MPELNELEDRVLLSATPMAVVEQVVSVENSQTESPPPSQQNEQSLTANNTQQIQSSQLTQSAQAAQFDFGTIDAPALFEELSPVDSAKELVVIDSSVPDAKQLINDLQSSTTRRFEIITLDAAQDGIEQITDALQAAQGDSQYDAIHIVSHGENGSVRLGNTWLSEASLDQHAASIGSWGATIGDEGDLLFYGCDLAENASGERLLNSIGLLTQADVAASVDDTGSALLGGDWDLEYQQGEIETNVAFSQSVQTDWLGLLALSNDEDQIYFTDYTAGSIHRLNGDGSVTDLFSGLGPNGPTVIEINELTNQLFWTNEAAGTISVGNADGTGAVTPLVTGQNTPIGLAVDPHGQKMYWLEQGTGNLRSADLDGGNVRTLLTGLSSPKDLELDLLHGKVYWVEGGGSPQIGVGDIGELAILNQNTVTTANMSQPTGLALDVPNGKLYWSDEALGTIRSADLNGNNEALVLSGLTTPVDVEIDPSSQRLYWASQSEGALYSASADGSDMRLEDNGISGPVGLAFSAGDTVIVNTNERRVNSYLSDIQETSRLTRGSTQAVAMDADGNYIVVWSSGTASGTGTEDGSGWGVYAQRYTADGFTNGNAFRVSNETIDNQRWASVAMNDEGYFAITWTSEGQDGSQEGVYARIFDPNGTSLTGDVRMNVTSTTGRQQNPAIELSDTGEILVAWEGSGPGDAYGVFARRIDLDGNSVDLSEFIVNTSTSGGQYDVSVDYHTDGSFVVTWDDDVGVHYRRFDVDGLPIDLTQVEVDGSATAGNADLGFQANGDLFVVWRDSAGDDTVYGRRFDSSGTPYSAKFIISQTTSGDQTDPSITVTSDGSAIVSWQGNGNGDTAGVFARKFDASGAALGTEFLINQDTANDQTKVSIAALDTDNFVAVWTTEVAAGDNDVVAQQFGTASATQASLLLSTADDVNSPSGVNGVDSWSDGTVLKFGDPNFSLGESTTEGTFSAIAIIDAIVQDGDADIDAYHYVTRDMVLGTNDQVTLKAGDILFSFADNEDINYQSGLVTHSRDDILLFSPTNAGGFTSGTLTTAFNGFSSLTDPDFSGINNIRGFTLIEETTVVGGETLNAGDFLYSRNTGSEDNDIFIFHTTEAGDGTTDGTTEKLLEGDEIGISHKVYGLHLFSSANTFGGESLNAGTLLVTLDGDGDVVGSTNTVVDQEDIFSLELSQTSIGGTAIGTASHFFDGSEVGLNLKNINAIAILNANEAPVAVDDNFTVNEDTVFTTPAGVLTNDTDLENSTLTTGNLDTTGTKGLVTLNANGTFTYDPNDEFESLGVGQTDTTSFIYTVYDGSGGTDTATVTLTIEGRNDAPTLDNSTDLTLADVDRDNDDPAGITVADLLASDGGDIIDDIDMFNPEGIAVVNAENNDGSWQYSTNGTTWINFGAVDSNNAVLLGTSNLVRFLPLAGQTGNSATLTFHAWDQTVGSVGDTNVNLGTLGIGGSGAFSTNTEDATITILDVDVAPVANNDTYNVDEDTTLTVNSDWWDVNWTSRRTLTFDNTARNEDLVNFPILVEIDSTRIDYSKAQANGEDLRFVDADGTVLDYEIETWNPSGTSLIWVKVPQIDANSNTDFIRMYYGNANAVDAQDSTAVWDAENEAVYHLSEDNGPTGILKDSTGNFDATNAGSENATDGKLFNGQKFSGNNQYINIGQDLPLVTDSDAVTLSAWVFSDDVTQDSTLISISVGASGASTDSRASLTVDGQNIEVIGRTFNTGIAATFTTTSNPLIQNQWQLITAVIDYTGDRFEIYVDGNLVGATNTFFLGNSNSANANNSAIGAQDDGSGGFFNGRMDEVRIIDGKVSAAWVSAQHASMTDGLTSYSSEETNAGVLGNDSDSNGDDFTAVLENGPTNAKSFQLFDDGSFNYTPNDDFVGTDTFTYTAHDGTNSSNTATVTITVNPANDAPVFNNNTLTISEGETVTLTTANILITDVDNADAVLTITASAITSGMFVDKDATGTAITTFTMQDIRDGEILFIQNGSAIAPSYELSVNDGAITIGPNVATINFTATNDPPVISAPTTVTAPKNGSVTFSSTSNAISFTDPDEDGGIMRVELTATDGTITLGNVGVVNIISDNGTSVIFEGTLTNLHTALNGVVFTPTTGFSGNASLGVLVNDYGNTGGANEIDTASITITVENGTPTARPGGPYTINEGTTLTLDGTNSNDPNGDGLTYRWDLNGDGTYGDVTGDNPNVTWATLRTFLSSDGTHTIGLQVDDGDGGVNSATTTLTITNLDPTANDDSQATDEDSAVSIPNILLNDTDPGGDTLSISSVDSTGVLGNLTNNGDGSFSYVPNGAFESLKAGEQATETFSYTISDGDGGESTATVTITIQGVNDDPTANTGGPYTIDEGSSLTLDGSASSDPENDGLTYRWDLNNDGNYGDVTGANEVITWASLQTFITTDGTHTIGLQVDDGEGGIVTNTTTVSINNLDPVAVNNAYTTFKNHILDIPNVLLNDSDPGGDTYTLTGFDATGLLGTLTNNGDGTFQYDPNGQFAYLNPGQQATETFTYTINDGEGGTATATVTITINGDNDTPTAVAGGPYTINEGGSLTLDGSGSSDPNSDTLTYRWDLNGDGNYDDATGVSPTLNWTQLQGFFNSDNTFTIGLQVDDGSGGISTASTTVTILNLNPNAIDDAVATDEDTSFTTANLLLNDTDAGGDTLTVTGMDATGVTGNLTNNGDGTFTYDPNGAFGLLKAGEQATETFTYTISDGDGGTSTATTTITINGVNDDPIANAGGPYTIDEGGSLTLDGTASSDPENDGLTYRWDLNNDGNYGDETGENPVVTWATLQTYITTDGTHTIGLQVDDGEGGVVTRTTTVTVVNLNPNAIDDAVATNEDNSFTTVNLLLNDTDAGGDTLTVSGMDATGVLGNLTNNGDGTFTYDPNEAFESLGAGQQATETFTYTISDDDGGTSTATATITINGVNDGPSIATVANQTVAENGTIGPLNVSIGDIDTPATSLTLSATSSDQTLIPNANISITGTGSTRTINVSPTAGMSGGPVTITLVVSDGELSATTTFEVTVTGSDNSPDIQVVTLNVEENLPVGTSAGTLVANDLDFGETFTWSITGGSGQSKFTIDANTGEVVTNRIFDHEADSRFTLNVKVVDSTNLEDETILFIDIGDTNDAPVAQADAYTVFQGDTLTVDVDGVIANDTDQDENGLTAVLVDNVSFGTLTFNTDGTFSYDTGTTFLAADSFTYRVNDGIALSEIVTVNINVSPVAPPPTDPPEEPPVNETETPEEETNTPDGENEGNTEGTNGGGSTPNTPPTTPELPNGGTDPESETEDNETLAFVSPTIDPLIFLRKDVDETSPLESPLTTQNRNSTEREVTGVSETEQERRNIATLSVGNQMNLGTFKYTVMSLQSLEQALTSQSYQQELDELGQTLESVRSRADFMKGSTAVSVSSTFTIGYVLWTLRGGLLLTSLLAQMPAWRLMDPLVVLEYLDSDLGDEDDESLESMVDNANNESPEAKSSEDADHV